MEDALALFHENKSIFIDLGIRTAFEMPKLHWAQHYVACIQRFGTTDNFNTEYTERLHIDFAKKAFRASNHKDELAQMTVWMDRKEKVIRFTQHLKWKQDQQAGVVIQPLKNPGLHEGPHYTVTENPTRPRVRITQLVKDYHALRFTATLKEFVIQNNQPHLTPQQVQQLSKTYSIAHVPYVLVYHKVKLWLGDEHQISWTRNEKDVIHVKSSHTNLL